MTPRFTRSIRNPLRDLTVEIAALDAIDTSVGNANAIADDPRVCNAKSRIFVAAGSLLFDRRIGLPATT